MLLLMVKDNFAYQKKLYFIKKIIDIYNMIDVKNISLSNINKSSFCNSL